MGLLANFNIAGSAISAQSVRLNTIASNLANVETVASSEAEAYRSKQPVFRALLGDQQKPAEVGVRIDGIIESETPVARRYEPGHPMADEAGYIFASNVNPVEEMANMISASRSFQNNLEILNTSRDLLIRALSLGN